MDEPELLHQNCIDRMRKKMFETAQSNGLNSIETIQSSQKLDILINQHMNYCSNNCIETLINAS